MKPTDLSIHVTSFLTHYLAAQRNLSPNTIKAYRDVFNYFCDSAVTCRASPRKSCVLKTSMFR